MSPTLAVRHLSVGRGVARRQAMEMPVLGDVSFGIAPGEILGLTGDSGVGKSLLGAAIVGLLPPGMMVLGGEMAFRGEALGGLSPRRRGALRGRGIAMVVQDAQAALDPTRRVGRQLDETLRLVRGLAASEARVRAGCWLRALGLDGLDARFAHQLSGGQRQRVAVALAMAAEPALLIADEPTASLDADNAARLAGLLRDQARRLGTSVLLVTHQTDMVRRFADRVLTLRSGRIDAPGINARHAAMPAPVPARAGPLVLRMQAVSLSYGRPAARVLHDISLTVDAAETLALVGESGSGKSSLARLACGLLQPGAGHVAVLGTPPRAGRTACAMVFQDARESLDPTWRVGDCVAEPLPRAARSAATVTALLRQVGLSPAMADRYPGTLSGGQAQRVAIARALAARPALLVCDEPTSALDAVARGEILALLLALQLDQGFAMLFATHDLVAARAVSHRAARLRAGRIVAYGSTGSVLGSGTDPA